MVAADCKGQWHTPVACMGFAVAAAELTAVAMAVVAAAAEPAAVAIAAVAATVVVDAVAVEAAVLEAGHKLVLVFAQNLVATAVGPDDGFDGLLVVFVVSAAAELVGVVAAARLQLWYTACKVVVEAEQMLGHIAAVAVGRVAAEEAAFAVLPWALEKRAKRAVHWRQVQFEVSTVETELVADHVAVVAVVAVAVAAGETGQSRSMRPTVFLH